MSGRKEFDLVQSHAQLAPPVLDCDEALVPHSQSKLHRKQRVARRAVGDLARERGRDGGGIERAEQQLLHLLASARKRLNLL